MVGLILDDHAVHICRSCKNCGDWSFVWSARSKKFADSRTVGEIENEDDVDLQVSPFHFPSQLFYVSRAISEDAMSMFYAENCFVIVCHLGFSVLRKWAPRPLKYLTRLCVHVSLDEWNCSFSSVHPLRPINQGRKMPKPAAHYKRQKHTISEWQSTCSHITSHIQSRRMKLDFFVASEDHKVIGPMLDSLLKLPTLATCSLYGGPKAKAGHTELIALLERTVLRATGQYTDTQSPFSFSKLPTEIQLCILENANLVAPRDVVLDSSEGFTICTPRCSGELSCCPKKRSAYSSEHHCWVFPAALFQASKRLRAQAQYIFFSGNRFIVERLSYMRSQKNRDPFLLIPPDSLKHIRFLIFSLYNLDYEDYRPGRLDTRNWQNIVDIIAHEIPLSQLTLVLDMTLMRDDLAHHFVPFVDDRDTQEGLLQERIVAPFTRLKGLRDLFVFVPPPLQLLLHETEASEVLERRLEQMVMGQEYDSDCKARQKLRDEKLKQY